MADYRKMWEELGMDLETHDQLCAVLPQAFGTSICPRRTARRVWITITWCCGYPRIRPAELIGAPEEGRKGIRTFCVYVPDEIVFAAGGIAHRAVRRFPVLGE